jgi:hypothetical protein
VNPRSTHRLAEEHDIGLDEPVACLAFRCLHIQDHALHLRVVVCSLTVDASLTCEATVCLNDLIVWHARAALEGVNILREACVQQPMRRQEADEGMRQGWSELAWVELVG